MFKDFNLKIEIDYNRSNTVSPWQRRSAYCFLARLCFFSKNYSSTMIVLFHSQKFHLIENMKLISVQTVAVASSTNMGTSNVNVQRDMLENIARPWTFACQILVKMAEAAIIGLKKTKLLFSFASALPNPLPNVCDSLPCKNGICELETLDSFHCRCESGYEGKFCENFTPCKYNFCNNGGQCIVLPDATYRCSGANYIFCSGDGTTKATSCCNMTSTVLQNSTTDKKTNNDAQKIFLKSKEDSCCTTDSQTADQVKRNATSRDTYKWSDLHLCIIHGVLVDLDLNYYRRPAERSGS
ncbi:Neurogenic locus notch -like protein 1 [Trichinella pseudospiralis]|uniref:Neurogenic locus notch-like protein 1 n=1 Tax=Trichinella pseudospiralis TaxID=6337 RepID=A0A0V0XZI9_TRIPS|nr:Neurogenic locus notch -like protein 1 [Trichinella pseudospiralis]